MSLILEESNKEIIQSSLDTISGLRKSRNRVGKNILFKTVWDELKQVMSTKWGILNQRIEGEIVNIIGNKESVPIKQYSQIVDLFEVDFKIQLNDNQNRQLNFIKENIWEINRPDTDYQWLLNRNLRARKYGETKLRLMKSLDLGSIKIFCNGNLFLYDCIPQVRDTLKNKDANHLKRINQILKGSRNSGGKNTSDKLHLLSCFFYIEENVRENLVFSTTDKPMLKNKSLIEKLPFKIVRPLELKSVISNL